MLLVGQVHVQGGLLGCVKAYINIMELPEEDRQALDSTKGREQLWELVEKGHWS